MTMADDLYTSLRTEILKIKDHAFQRSGTKIAFTTILMGLGSIRLSLTSFDDPQSQNAPFHVEPLLYLAPLVAIFYDALLFSDKRSIRRIGQFIMQQYPDTYGRWERFVGFRRAGWFGNIGEMGFTGLVLVYCPVLALHRYNEAKCLEASLKTAVANCLSSISVLSRENITTFLGGVHGWWFMILWAIWLSFQISWLRSLYRDRSFLKPG